MKRTGRNNLDSLRSGGVTLGELPVVRKRKSSAFTLIELMVVLLILAIGVALVVGVGATVQETARSEETRNIQRVVLASLQTYYNAAPNAYPDGDGAPDSSISLLVALRTVAPSRKELHRLPKHAISEDDTGREHLLDGFGNPMLYFKTGGLAGRTPRLLSRGANLLDPTDDIASDM